MNNKAQGVVEFAVVFGAILFFFVIFFSIIQGNQNEKNKEKERAYLQSVLLDVQDELSIAAGSSNGYYRQFSIPQSILGADYNINKTGTYLYGDVNDYHLNYRVPETNGTLKKGANIIRKENGTVFIN